MTDALYTSERTIYADIRDSDARQRAEIRRLKRELTEREAEIVAHKVTIQIENRRAIEAEKTRSEVLTCPHCAAEVGKCHLGPCCLGGQVLRSGCAPSAALHPTKRGGR
jgi:hypothetical protein